MNPSPFITLPKRDQALDDLIGRQLARTGWVLAFPPELEERFNAHIHASRHRQIVRAALVGIGFLFAFVAVDLIYRPELIVTLTIIRAGVIGSLMAALSVVIAFRRDTRLPGLMSILGISVASLGAGLMLTTVGNPIVQYEPYIFILVAVIANIALPLRPPQALLASAINFAIAIYFILPLPTLVPDEKASPLIFLLATTVMTMLANVRIETIERKIFLLYLREKLRGEALLSEYRSLDHISNTDALTDLANRRLFDEFLRQSWQEARFNDEPLTLLMIDIDHFKGYNDTYGHPAGDECLKQVARALKASTRAESDLPARFGGEEFALVLPNCEEDDGLAMARRIHEAIAGLDILHATSPLKRLSVSIGVATERPANTRHEPRSLLIRADRALYAAKQGGRNLTSVDRPGEDHRQSAAAAVVNGSAAEQKAS
ncbi:diguanylate cyclase [Martelella lutilitoris]|uniref:diguanylate cyclase n=1 Tax=Martelella lutilitoris TaxID=2583532 RepID=A0A5C4JS96_9HYPH|nr:diguanylate cyclase [Martelella lutilitoris]TNB48024.1 diguanylate cyclase [Martelella lutilitoris]